LDEDQRPPEDRPTETEIPEPSLPEHIGNYRLLQKVGEGGMGEVYEADQETPVRRRVALKLIKAGMDTKQVVARFESERQALALMDHPNIARVFDAGATDQGRPYFAMELVRGEPITRYCRRHHLSTRERIELFMAVCHGVQHAHQKGIIHRDIKPSNILVTIQENRPVPKIIDFGVAKATAQRLTEKTLFTQVGGLIGTPEYMSPEQAEMSGLDIDTRSDVYSLGVVLYELLAGALPFDSKELRSASIDEVRRRIREEEPSKPSTRLSFAGRSHVNVRTLKRQLSGDLDWITMKALEKDRTRRYASPSEFAADLDRHLRCQPVVAGPPTTVYRMGKFVRRHKIGVTVAAAALLLLAGIAARERATSSRIAKEAATAREISEFLVELFRVSDPGEARGSTITAREILDKGAKRVDRELSDQPELQVRLMNAIGKVYRNLGLYSRAESLLEDSLDTGRRVLGDDHADTLVAMNDLAVLYKRRGRHAEAERLYLEAIEGCRRAHGEGHEKTLAAMNNLAVLYTTQSRFEEAEPLQLRIVEGFRRVRGEHHRDTLAATSNLAYVYQEQGRDDEAEPLYLAVIEGQTRVLTADHPNTLWSKNNLANLYERRGRYEDAERLHLETLEARIRVLGEDHPDTMRSLEMLVRVYMAKSEPDRARPYSERLLALHEKVVRRPDASPADRNGYAWLLLTCEPADLRDPPTALRLAIEANDMTGHARPGFLDTLSLGYYLTGRLDEAIATQKKAVSLLPPGDTLLRAELETRLAEFESAREGDSE
jgi:non-specific serine/threonine protein kinase/serine/threonine-protein kinase